MGNSFIASAAGIWMAVANALWWIIFFGVVIYLIMANPSKWSEVRGTHENNERVRE